MMGRSQKLEVRSQSLSLSARAAHFAGALAGGFRRGYMGAILGTWEGHERDRRRHRPPAETIAEDPTLDYGRRAELMSEARSLCNTHGLCNRVIRQYANYVVGKCQPRWLTADEAWNEATEQAFYDWSLNCDLRSTVTLQQKARLHVMTMIRDGDSFGVKINFEGEPKLQDVEPDRIGNYRGGRINFDEDNIVGGITIDAIGRPSNYQIWDRTRFGMFENRKDRSPAEVLHIYDSTRFDAVRGVTHFAPVLNHVRDVKETLDAQRAKQKLTSKIALLIRNALAGPQTGNIDVLGDDTDAKGASIKTEAMGDGAIKYQFHGDEMEVFHANDPSDGWFRLTDHEIRLIACGLDLPYEFVWDMAGLAGPGTRMMSAQAQRTFRGKMDILENRYLNPVAAWWITFQMNEGRLPFNAEWYKFRFQRPAHLTIDNGRDSKSNLAELAAGVSTECRIAEELGEDDEEVAETRKKEVLRKIVFAKEITAAHPEVSLQEALDLIGRQNIPTRPDVETAAADTTAEQPAQPSRLKKAA